jgi:hypothetical protein
MNKNERLMMELEHCLNTIEFLHGCLTDPAHFKCASQTDY